MDSLFPALVLGLAPWLSVVNRMSSVEHACCELGLLVALFFLELCHYLRKSLEGIHILNSQLAVMSSTNVKENPTNDSEVAHLL